MIVGKRALPAIGLTHDGGRLSDQFELIGEPEDVVIAFGAGEEGGEEVRAGARARQWSRLPDDRPLSGAPAPSGSWLRSPPIRRCARSSPRPPTTCSGSRSTSSSSIAGLLGGRDARPVHDSGASSFLYPFLAEGESELEPVIADVRDSVLMKAEEIGALRERMLEQFGGDAARRGS